MRSWRFNQNFIFNSKYRENWQFQNFQDFKFGHNKIVNWLKFNKSGYFLGSASDD